MVCKVMGVTMRERDVTSESAETRNLRLVVALLNVVVVIFCAIALWRGAGSGSGALFALLLASTCLSGGYDNLFTVRRISRPHSLQDRVVALVSFLALGCGLVAIGMVIALARGTLTTLPSPFIGAFALIALTNTYISFALLPAMASRRERVRNREA